MNRLTTLALLLTVSLCHTPVFAQDTTPAAASFSPMECARIQSVDVPYDVQMDKDVFTFTNDDHTIVSTSAKLTLDGRALTNPDAEEYHLALKSFFEGGERMQATLNAAGIPIDDPSQIGDLDWEGLARDGKLTMEVMKASFDSCSSIFLLDQINASAGEGFVPVVEVTLSPKAVMQ